MNVPKLNIDNTYLYTEIVGKHFMGWVKSNAGFFDTDTHIYLLKSWYPYYCKNYTTETESKKIIKNWKTILSKTDLDFFNNYFSDQYLISFILYIILN